MVSFPSQCRIVLVEPLYPVNLGSIARVMKNFGCRDLVLVRPVAQPDAEVQRYAKRAWNIILKARRAESIAQAVEGTDWVLGTTGITQRFRRGMKNCWSLKEVAEKIGPKDKVSLVFGNEGTGLSQPDLDACDALITIPTSARYPVMNLSHAVAVVLYELAAGRKKITYYPAAPRGEVENLARMMDEMIGNMDRVRDKKKVGKAFRSVLGRARVADDELHSLFAAVGALRKALKKP